MAPLHKRFLLNCTAIAVWGAIPLTGQAEFNLNFAPAYTTYQGSPVQVSCNRPGLDQCKNHIGPSVDKTPFLQEIVSDPGGTGNYYHVIVGLPGDSFVQESYIKVSGTYITSDSDGNQFYSSTSGGAWWLQAAGNPTDPLRNDAGFTGNGTGNPNKMSLRQILTDTSQGYKEEFLKAKFTEKPSFTQSVNNSELQMNFGVDMSGINYNTSTMKGAITNTLKLLDTLIPQDSASFDAVAQSQTSTTSAGQYTYSPGFGPGASAGAYKYVDGGFDVYNIDWKSFRDPTQNP